MVLWCCCACGAVVLWCTVVLTLNLWSYVPLQARVSLIARVTRRLANVGSFSATGAVVPVIATNLPYPLLREVCLCTCACLCLIVRVCLLAHSCTVGRDTLLALLRIHTLVCKRACGSVRSSALSLQ